MKNKIFHFISDFSLHSLHYMGMWDEMKYAKATNWQVLFKLSYAYESYTFSKGERDEAPFHQLPLIMTERWSCSNLFRFGTLPTNYDFSLPLSSSTNG